MEERIANDLPGEPTTTDAPAIIDEAMLAMSEFVAQMTEVDGYLFDEEWQVATRLEDVEMSIPIQLDLHVNDDGRVTIGGSPPLFYVDTTVMPVFHQLKVTINVNENSENDARSSQQRMES
jgi:hypothetical protein